MTDFAHQKPDIKKANPCPPCPDDARAWDRMIYWLGIGLGSGKPRFAAGTWGTVGGVVAALPLFWFGKWVFLAATLVAIGIGCPICAKTSRLMDVHDDPHIVFDEWVGVWIALLPLAFLPAAHAFLGAKMALFWVMAFVLFRLFDIVKPFPIGWVDRRVSGGLGIVLDDVLAGIMAAIVLAVLVCLVDINCL